MKFTARLRFGLISKSFCASIIQDKNSRADWKTKAALISGRILRFKMHGLLSSRAFAVCQPQHLCTETDKLMTRCSLKESYWIRGSDNIIRLEIQSTRPKQFSALIFTTLATHNHVMHVEAFALD
jgi:hypothetical protein